MIGRKEGRGVKAAMTSLGYVPNERFNALRGDRRMLFYDTANGRQIDVRLDIPGGRAFSSALHHET